MHAAVAILLAGVVWSLCASLLGAGRRILTAKPLHLHAPVVVPILVGDAAAELRMVRSLLGSCAHPSRLVFVLPSGRDDGRIQMLRKATEPHEALRFVDSASPTVEECVEDEDAFVLLLSPGVQMAQGWDEALIGTLSSLDSSSILTTVPLESSASFPAVSRVERGRFHTRGLPIHTPLQQTTPALLWSPHFSFSRGGIVGKVVPQAPWNQCRDNVSLWTSGATFFSPTELVASRVERARIPPRSNRSASGIGGVRPSSGFYRHAGINIANSVASTRSLAGLSPMSDDTERIVKFGSVRNCAKFVRRPT